MCVYTCRNEVFEFHRVRIKHVANDIIIERLTKPDIQPACSGICGFLQLVGEEFDCCAREYCIADDVFFISVKCHAESRFGVVHVYHFLVVWVTSCHVHMAMPVVHDT